MSDKYRQFEQRKQDHIDIVLEKPVQTNDYSDFHRIQLIHEALPDLNFDQINLLTQRFGQEADSPFLVSSMTAGHKGACNINQILMEACAETGWPMGVGSQRRELTDPDAGREWRRLLNAYPRVTLFSNLGIAQLCQTKLDLIRQLIDNLHAKALIIHLNPLQECIQPEGTPHFKGSWHALEQVVKSLSLPVVVKETGCGFASATLTRLNDIGIAAVDVSGLGGTHWGRVEGYRSHKNSPQAQAAITFNAWGISTLQSIINARSINPDYEIWGSGGVRSGLDAAKLLALGATTIGLAKPMLKAAVNGVNAVIEAMHCIEYELKVALFCTGSETIQALQEKHHAIKC